LIAAVATRPELYWELVDLLPPGCFTEWAEAWAQVAAAVEGDGQPVVPEGWEPARDPLAAAHRLADLYQRRQLASTLERLAEGLSSDAPASELLTVLEEEAARVQAAVREAATGRLVWAEGLVGAVLEDIRQRRVQRQQTGKPILGLDTGIPRLNEIVGGLRDEGLYILAGPPGAGKTSFALQVACRVAGQVPVVYVTFENPPANLVLKVLCRMAEVSPRDAERGLVDPNRLRAAAADFRFQAQRLAFLEGTSRTTVAQVRARALQALARHRAERCLVVVDYLQRMAHGRGYTDLRSNVSALVGELTDLARRLKSPVLALSSLSRAGYRGGEARADLAALKESGDLEYGADVVMFLATPDERKATPPARAVDLVVGKNRYGELGSVPLVFRADIGLFGEEGWR
jgi:replicative DNA helicase